MDNVKFGIIGLGRMGSAIAQRVAAGGYEVLGFDPKSSQWPELQTAGIKQCVSIHSLAQEATIIWLMVPAGKIVDEVIETVLAGAKPHTILIEGGNSYYVDSMRRAIVLSEKNINYLDCGVSGGIHGFKNGFCLMIGGVKKIYEQALPVLQTIAAPHGCGYMGPSGAGHYVKMIHNGIEYGMLQSYAEGFHLLREGTFKHLDLKNIAQVWQQGSVIRSWLLELAYEVFAQDQFLKTIGGKIEEGGTGAWTVQTAHENKIPVPLIEKSLEVRKWSRHTGGNFATKFIQMLRNAFGGHPIEIYKDEQ